VAHYNTVFNQLLNMLPRRLDIIDLLNLSLIKLQKLKEPSYQLSLF